VCLEFFARRLVPSYPLPTKKHLVSEPDQGKALGFGLRQLSYADEGAKDLMSSIEELPHATAMDVVARAYQCREVRLFRLSGKSWMQTSAEWKSAHSRPFPQGRAGLVSPLYRWPEIEYPPVLELDPDSTLDVRDTRNLTFATDLLQFDAMPQAMNPNDPTRVSYLLAPLGNGGKRGNTGDAIVVSLGILPGRWSGILGVSQLDVVSHPRPSPNKYITRLSLQTSDKAAATVHWGTGGVLRG